MTVFDYIGMHLLYLQVVYFLNEITSRRCHLLTQIKSLFKVYCKERNTLSFSNISTRSLKIIQHIRNHYMFSKKRSAENVHVRTCVFSSTRWRQDTCSPPVPLSNNAIDKILVIWSYFFWNNPRTDLWIMIRISR